MTAPQTPPTSVMHRVGQVLKWASIATAVLILGGAVLAALAVQGQASNSLLIGLAKAAGAMRRWGLLVQTLLVVALTWGWPRLVAAGLKCGIVKQHEYAAVLALRWRVLAFGVAYLLLVPIDPVALWHLVF